MKRAELHPPDGALTVWDTGRGVLSRWSPDGELIDETTAPRISYFGPGLHLVSGRIDVLSPEGRYRGTVEAEVMSLAFVSFSRFVGLRLQEETGRPVLSLVDLEETGDTTTAGGRGETDGRPARAVEGSP